MSKLSLLCTTLGIIVNQNIDVDQLIHEVHRLGSKVVVYSRSKNQTIRDADVKIIGQLNDKNKLKEFATQCQIVVYINGSGISNAMINYLQQFTNVPQGTGALDIINDRSIQRVFLDALQIRSLPYDTVFSLSDVKQSISSLHSPLLLRPVQTSYVQQRDVLITNVDQLNSLKPMFNGEAYLVESLPKHARYFQLTAVKSDQGLLMLPLIEEHYSGQKLSFANVGSDVASDVINQFKQSIVTITNHVNYRGALTVSFILTSDKNVYVDGISSSFNFANNIYNSASHNFYSMFLRALVDLPIQAQPIHNVQVIKSIDSNNLSSLKKLWINNNLIIFDLSSLSNNTVPLGYALLSSSSFGNAIKKLRKDQF